MSDKKLTLKEQKFVDHYLEHGNASEAARQAGYSTKHVNRSAYEVMERPHIKAYIDKTRRLMKKEADLSISRMLKYVDYSMNLFERRDEPDRAKGLMDLACKILGHYAPEKQIINISGDLAIIEELTKSYMKSGSGK